MVREAEELAELDAPAPDNLERMFTVLLSLWQALDESFKRAAGRAKKSGDDSNVPPKTVLGQQRAIVMDPAKLLLERLQKNNFERLDQLPLVFVLLASSCTCSLAHPDSPCGPCLAFSPQGAMLQFLLVVLLLVPPLVLVLVLVVVLLLLFLLLLLPSLPLLQLLMQQRRLHHPVIALRFPRYVSLSLSLYFHHYEFLYLTCSLSLPPRRKRRRMMMLMRRKPQ